MSKDFSPMLAADIEDESWLEQLKFPVLASTKIDGIRGTVIDGKLTSRTGKLLPNRYIQSRIQKHGKMLEGLDGEITVGPPAALNVFQVSTSAVMSMDGEPDFKFHVFDHVETNPYLTRLNYLKTFVDSIKKFDDAKSLSFINILEQVPLQDIKELLHLETIIVDQLKFEGLILRAPNGRYKYGRSSFNEGLLLKFKRFIDSECVVYGFEEGNTNTNRATKDAHGHTVRSSHKAGKIPNGSMGKFLVKDCPHFPGVLFKIGTGIGLTHALRKQIWAHQNQFDGKIIKFQFQKCGVKDKPRFPSYQGFRDPIDM